MVDSDEILGNDVLRLLLEAKKDYISGLVWTKFKPWCKWTWPNAWDMDKENKKHIDIDSTLRAKIIAGGVHQVQVTGGCALIVKKALKIINYTIPAGVVGEDMAIAISAKKAGIPIFLHADVKIEHRRRR
jgi:hypothetical protein